MLFAVEALASLDRVTGLEAFEAVSPDLGETVFEEAARVAIKNVKAELEIDQVDIDRVCARFGARHGARS